MKYYGLAVARIGTLKIKKLVLAVAETKEANVNRLYTGFFRYASVVFSLDPAAEVACTLHALAQKLSFIQYNK